MRAAAVFHDVGKAVQYYQHQFNEKCECLKTEGPSFYLHEVLSAVYFDFSYRAMAGGLLRLEIFPFSQF
jgi:CRISPR/Cas system-associated endonuclease Cas3-HD